MDKIELKKCPKCLREFKGILATCPWCGTPLDQITKLASSNSNSLEFIQVTEVHPTKTKKTARQTTNNKKDTNSISKFKISFIPGFRTGSKWKMLMAIIYYVFWLLMAPSGIQISLFNITIPFFIFNLIKSIKAKSFVAILTTIISFTIMIYCLFI